MCQAPGVLSDGTEISCRKCWQCLERKVDDWVGRCIAENKTSSAAHSITLTYGRDEHGNEDHMRAAWLTYSDVQKFFKRLRFDGYQFRYLVAGEYGSTKGRAHWHLLIFWLGKVPPHELTTSRQNQRRFENKYWPHGFQHWEKPTARSIRYVCKYIQKDIGKDERQGHLSMSKKPPLGDAYFRALAAQYAKQGLAPQDLTYRFPEVKNEKGAPKIFYMSDTTAENFLGYYVEAWKTYQGGHLPNSQLVEAYQDKLAALVSTPKPDTFRRWVPPLERGSGPFIGPDPDNKGIPSPYSDRQGWRYWYRKTDEDGWIWQREAEKREAPQATPAPQTTDHINNPYYRAKHGLR